MSDLKKYINKRKIKDKDFSRNFEEGYKKFKIGVILKQERESAGNANSGLSGHQFRIYPDTLRMLKILQQ